MGEDRLVQGVFFGVSYSSRFPPHCLYYLVCVARFLLEGLPKRLLRYTALWCSGVFLLWQGLRGPAGRRRGGRSFVQSFAPVRLRLYLHGARAVERTAQMSYTVRTK